MVKKSSAVAPSIFFLNCFEMGRENLPAEAGEKFCE
jgi:hypothetical protein